jgi:hypothetical protein
MPADVRHLLPWAAVGLLLAVVVGCSPGPAPAAADADADPVEPDLPPPDPRLTFDTPYRNVKPGVRYLGDAACAGCHPTIDKTYHQHPMGRSAALVGRGPEVERFDPAARPTFTAGGFELSAEKTPAGMVHRVKARDGSPPAEYAAPAEIAIGSGTRGRSYLTTDGGAVWQTPVSWFGPDARWDLSPGFRLGTGARRPIVPSCLFCHVDHVEPVPGAENRYNEPLFPGQVAIGCERCHGPGELHAAERSAGAVPDGPDTAIVNPRHLPPALQAAVCEQCHLQGEERVDRRGRDPREFRPGLPFELFVSAHVRHPDIAEAHKSVGQFEQMERSKCFTGTGGRLVCTSCHDPHASPAAAAGDAFYRSRCLTCHGQKGCTAPAPEREARADSCAACHMPKAASANIVHASVTDHRVPRRPTPPAAPKLLPLGTSPLVRFRAGPYSPPEAERDRDLGVALARYAEKADDPQTLAGLSRMAAERLTASLRLWPGDAEAWRSLAGVRDGAGERVRAAANAARLAPGSEVALATLVRAATDARRYDLAGDAATRLIGLNPSSHEARVARAFVHLQQRRWAEAEADGREAVRLHPLHPEARLYLAIARHRLGDSAGARREMQAAAAAEPDPRQRAALRDLFQRATR